MIKYLNQAPQQTKILSFIAHILGVYFIKKLSVIVSDKLVEKK